MKRLELIDGYVVDIQNKTGDHALKRDVEIKTKKDSDGKVVEYESCHVVGHYGTPEQCIKPMLVDMRYLKMKDETKLSEFNEINKELIRKCEEIERLLSLG